MMKRGKNSGNFWLCLLFNMLMNLPWTIPAWILLALHFLLEWPLWPFWVALGVWFVSLLLWMSFIGWAAGCGNVPDPPKENKNPYSVKKTVVPQENTQEREETP